jgi:flagellar motility protein MotE (MotC chaperone)
MAEKEISLLKEQIKRLDEKKFDLEAWKNRTIIFLERIFGKESPKLRMIKELHYDYSSWSLRDTFAAGSTRDKDPVRIQAKEILEAIISELESLGLPNQKQEKLKIRELLTDELTGKQVKEIDSLINSNDSSKNERIAEIIENMDKEIIAAIIAKILTS